MPVSYDTLTVDTSTAPTDTLKGQRFPLSCRTFTVGIVPADANVRVSFDTQGKLFPVKGGEVFRACGAQPFESVTVLWDAVEVDPEAVDADYNVYFFGGGDAVSLEMGAPREDVPDSFRTPVIYSYDMVTGSRVQAVDGAAAPLSADIVRVRAPSSNGAVVTVYLGGVGGAGEELAPGEYLEYDLGADGAELWFDGTTGDVVTVYDRGN